jgi:hypothetical protein
MKWLIVGVLISALVSTSAYAGPADESVTRAGGIRKSVEQIRFGGNGRGSSYPPPYHLPRRNSTAQKATAAFAIGVLSMVGGAYAGAWLGALVPDHCGCESVPIPTGALIGMPVGAAAGGVLGWHLAR